jgi:hypothetical protein
MDNTLAIVIGAVMVVALFTTVYKKLPFKKYGGTKPKLAFFPKYIADYQKSIENVEESLAILGFKPSADPTYFYRGKVYGDLSAKRIKLSVKINEKDSQIQVQASALGILFDTGDVWQVTTDILNTPNIESS